MRLYKKIALLVGIVLSIASSQPVRGDLLTFADSESWQAVWELKPGLTVINEDGHLGLVKFKKDINALEDAHLFSHDSNERGEVVGGVWSALSNEADAQLIIDGDKTTYWRPDGDDSINQWIVQFDLGRSVLVKEIRLHFPDEEGAHPFRQFSVFTATGAQVSVREDLFRFEPVFRTTKPNTDSLVSFGFSSDVEDTTRVVDGSSGLADSDFQTAAFKANTAAGAQQKVTGLVEANSQWKMIQYVRILVEEKQLDGALAELEVIAVGDNIGIGVEGRGATFVNGSRATDPLFWFDGNLNTFGVIEVHQQFTESRGSAFDGGLWWQVDLGATYWVDDVFMYWQKPGERLSQFRLDGNNAGTGYNFFSSDGTRTLSGDIDYDEWIFEPEWTNSREQFKRHFRYLFKPRKVRHIFWLALHDLGWRSHPMEFNMFSPGYPAEVVMRSDFLNLGDLAGDGQPKVIKAIHWDADLPPGARIELRTRSGNEQGESYTFFNKIGELVTEEKWNSSPKVLRGRIDTTVVVGEDWSAWSNEYKLSGETFKSDSPRRFVQMELILATEDYNVAPLVRSVSLEYVDALVNGARGTITPRSAKPNEDTRFTYTLWPEVTADNSGFDKMRFVLPDLLRVDEIDLTVGGQPVAPTATNIEADSLTLSLPETVTGDSVQVSFTTRLIRNAAVIELDLASSESPGLWQDVEPASRRSNVVLLPDLATSDKLIDELQLSSQVFTPNGDGINDEFKLSFVLLKADGFDPSLQILDLAGRVVASLQAEIVGPARRFSWDGANSSGKKVQPGVYLLRIDANADSGDATQFRTISVAY
ncbi:MAG: T9SS type B sorting domain-containing protein [Candidatus Latescibacterota bacterium]|jgi:hypothetical protein